MAVNPGIPDDNHHQGVNSLADRKSLLKLAQDVASMASYPSASGLTYQRAALPISDSPVGVDLLP